MDSLRSLPALPDRLTIIDLPVPPTDTRAPAMVGLAVIAVALGGFGLWASLAPLDSAVVTQGIVAVESKRKLVQHREGGIVGQLLVREGDRVAAGAPLVRLTDATAQTQMQTLAAQLDARRAERARLAAERDGKSTIAFPPELTARQSDPAVAELLAREQDRFAQRALSREGQRDILQSRIGQLESTRRGRTMLEQSKREQLALLQQEIEGLRRLEAKGYYPTNKLRGQERELARMQGEMLSDGAGAESTDQEVAETRLQILQADQKLREEVAADLIRTENEIGELSARLAAATDAVERLQVVAPVDGIVQNIKVAGPGAVLPPGGELMEVVPGGDRLIVEARVNSGDIDRVHAGQAAELRFTAFGSRTTPVIDGEVAVVAADASTDEATRQPYYTARVEVAEGEVARLPRALRAGMPVEVMLEGGSSTPLQYFLRPLTDSFARGFRER
ncbi:HlyD family type I secretion periplasmic adaptor subunit [Magnetospirillum sp. UT-4]|uniref:HlyD family type I secretion periplasmic adaptor subunit n=1 Tax=Magnetospirillum sp. UT-4 TaxID=2681467 RepID=UPI00138653F0|nr:HlyD family type I secretion periplasmic adaptor subunit [Magnetospirillum sp. UT-4]CAA7625500.1 Type I secretion membrane fusion protein, HlyD [Magnetospirillum sp. UT-4]